MKRKLAKAMGLSLSTIMAMSLLAGCGESDESTQDSSSNKQVQSEDGVETAETSKLTFWFPPIASGDDGALPAHTGERRTSP